MFKGLIVGLGLLTAMASAALAADPQPWPENLYNPHADADDLTLPMPCGGKMVFRRVEVPGENALADRRVQLGGADERFQYAENVRPDYLAAGFEDAKQPTRHFYYLAKYETTKAQMQALTEPCVEATGSGRLPATEVAWIDAERFAASYSEWLYKTAYDALPKVDGTAGFLRLPTESEWEFAARGGIAVSDSQFQDPAFPMPDGIAKYVWFQGSRSANNQLQPVGLLKPNPLGLYDMLGNADELVQDIYRLNRLNRLHGQAGGYVAKGGNYLTSEGDIRSSYRQEVVPYDKNGPRRVRTIGFRLALVPPVVTSAKRLEEIRKAWKELPATGGSVAGEPLEDPIDELAALTKATDDPALKKRLEGFSTVVKANIAARNQQRDRAAKSTIRLGSFLGVKLSEDLKLVQRKKDTLANLQKAGASDTILKAARDGIAADEQAIAGNLDYYRETITQLVQEYPKSVVDAQAQTLGVEFDARGLSNLKPYATTFVAHAARYRSDGKLDPAAVTADYAK